MIRRPDSNGDVSLAARTQRSWPRPMTVPAADCAATSAYSGAVLVSPSRTPYPENSRNAAQQMQQFLDCLPVLLNPPRTVDLSARGETPRAVSRREFCSGSRRRRQALNEIRAISTTRSPSKSRKRRPRGFHHGLLEHPPQYKAKVSTRCSFGRTGRNAPCSHTAVTPIYDRDQGSSANRSGDDPFTTLDKGDTTAKSIRVLFIYLVLFIYHRNHNNCGSLRQIGA
jgi:hypothetical protein